MNGNNPTLSSSSPAGSAPEGAKTTKIILWVVIAVVVVVALIVAFYIFMGPQGAQQEEAAPASGSGASGASGASVDVEAQAIESELRAFDLEGLDKELGDLNIELK